MKRFVFLLAIFSLTATVFAGNEKYFGLPLTTPEIGAISNDFGVPFVEGPLPLEQGGSVQVTVGGIVDRIFLLGMTDQISEKQRAGRSKHAPSELIRPAIPVDAWTDPRDQSV